MYRAYGRTPRPTGDARALQEQAGRSEIGRNAVPPPSRLKLFQPILPGATLSERLRASAAALFGIAFTGFVCGLLASQTPHVLWLVPPMGASAVLLFAVPSSPMAQPWPVIGGNAISALVGVVIGHTVGEPALAAGLAVGLAILAMSLTRSLHPPGGAAALVGVFAGDTASYLFPLTPVALNAALLVGCAWLYHRAAGTAYPHRPVKPAAAAKDPARPTFSPEDVDAALVELGESFDISRDDLERLLREIEKRALARAYVDLVCRDLMTHGVIFVDERTPRETVAASLAKHDFRSLPVLDDAGRLLGVIGQRELAAPGETARDIMSPAATASPETPALSLLDKFSRGRVHAVYVIDGEKKVLGVVTEADWLAVLTRGLDVKAKAA
jgi:CBS domain-containing membrane protein